MLEMMDGPGGVEGGDGSSSGGAGGDRMLERVEGEKLGERACMKALIQCKQPVKYDRSTVNIYET